MRQYSTSMGSDGARLSCFAWHAGSRGTDRGECIGHLCPAPLCSQGHSGGSGCWPGPGVPLESTHETVPVQVLARGTWLSTCRGNGMDFLACVSQGHQYRPPCLGLSANLSHACFANGKVSTRYEEHLLRADLHGSLNVTKDTIATLLRRHVSAARVHMTAGGVHHRGHPPARHGEGEEDSEGPGQNAADWPQLPRHHQARRVQDWHHAGTFGADVVAYPGMAFSCD